MKRIPWRAIISVAAVYGYFLIFAQFSFVELLRASGMSVDGERGCLAAMALAGIAGGFLMAKLGVTPQRTRRAMAVAAVAAMLSPWISNAFGLGFIAVVTGASLGVATVGLSTLLRGWCRLEWVGVGTGLGYALCNIPAVFQSSAVMQSMVGAGFALAAVGSLPKFAGSALEDESEHHLSVWVAVVMFTALVWLDSAAFFIIQHAVDLKSGTWASSMLWRNAWLHLFAGCLAGYWLSRGRARSLLLVAWSILALAATVVNHESTRPLAGWLYPVAVSFYSTALVVWPGWSGVSSTRAIGWRAAWLFGVAGWIGSANGIGMAESLHRVPIEFVVASAIVVSMALANVRRSWRIVLMVAVVALAAVAGDDLHGSKVAADPVARGRQVYLSEGCIHCHSQYVRPGTRDEVDWGPVRPLDQVLSGNPVLIGNRRQGPDLSNVGARRSEAWLRQHFLDPRSLMPASNMPDYRHLQEDGRLDDLVTYLRMSGVSMMGDWMRSTGQWKPLHDDAGSEDGRALFAQNCAMCHGASGKGDGELARGMSMRPSNLVDGPFVWTVAGPDQRLRMARVVKFGIIGANMPGHETLSDSQVAALVNELIRLRSGRVSGATE